MVNEATGFERCRATCFRSLTINTVLGFGLAQAFHNLVFATLDWMAFHEWNELFDRLGELDPDSQDYANLQVFIEEHVYPQIFEYVEKKERKKAKKKAKKQKAKAKKKAVAKAKNTEGDKENDLNQWDGYSDTSESSDGVYVKSSFFLMNAEAEKDGTHQQTSSSSSKS